MICPNCRLNQGNNLSCDSCGTVLHHEEVELSFKEEGTKKTESGVVENDVTQREDVEQEVAENAWEENDVAERATVEHEVADNKAVGNEMMTNEAVATPQEAPLPIRAEILETLPFRISLTRVLFMSVLTAGAYLFYWSYRTWKQFRDHTNATAYPVWHALSLIVPIYGLFRFYAHMRSFNALMVREGLPNAIHAGWALFLFVIVEVIDLIAGKAIFFGDNTHETALLITKLYVMQMIITTWLLLYSQGQLNNYWSSLANVKLKDARIGIGEVIFAVLGLLFWLDMSAPVFDPNYTLSNLGIVPYSTQTEAVSERQETTTNNVDIEELPQLLDESRKLLESIKEQKTRLINQASARRSSGNASPSRINLQALKNYKGQWVTILTKDGLEREGRVVDVEANVVHLEQNYDYGSISIRVPVQQIEGIR